MNVYKFYISLFRYQRKYPLILITAIVSNTLMSLTDCALPLLVIMLFNYLSGIGSYSFWTIAALFILNFIVLAVTHVFTKSSAAQLGANIIADLRFRILEKIQSGNGNPGTKNESGQILGNFTSSLTLLETTIIYQTWMYFSLAILAFISGITLLYVNWRISIVVFICMAAMYKVPNYFSKKATFYLNKKKEIEWALVDHIQEEMTLARIIRIFLLTEFRQILFKNLLQKSKKFDALYGTNLALIGGSAFLSISIVKILVLIIGGFLVKSHYLTLIELTGFYLAFGNFGSAINSLTNKHSSIEQGAESLGQIEKMLAESERTEDSKRDIVLSPFSKNIVFNEVSFYYGEQCVLSNINLEIYAGQSVAFVGPSGSGKSTLLSLLLCDNSATQGEILVDGINLDRIYLPSLFKQIGVIYQKSLLFNATIRENIRLGKQTATQDEIVLAAQQAELHHDLSQTQLTYDTVVDQQNHSLSGGQCQRIAIARALISSPAILYLDEATSALDPLSADAIDTTLDKMAGKRTVISVTHRLRSAMNADQIIVMEKGKIVERGSHKELLTKSGLYSQLWEKQHGITLSSDNMEGTFNPIWFKFVPLFESLSSDILQQLGSEFEIETIEENQLIFNEGDPGSKFYVIAASIVSVSRYNEKTNQHEHICTLSDGDFFGEVALINTTLRNASIHTSSSCIFMTLTAHRFHRVLIQLPDEVRNTIIEKGLARMSPDYI